MLVNEAVIDNTTQLMLLFLINMGDLLKSVVNQPCVQIIS